MLALSESGDNAGVDMLVGDICALGRCCIPGFTLKACLRYADGSDYSKIGLKSTTIASSFGKVFRKGARGRNFKPEDIARSLLYAVSNNIGQIAWVSSSPPSRLRQSLLARQAGLSFLFECRYMNAEKHNLHRIYFGGCFIRGHAATISTLSYAIRFWSKGTKKALFLRHEGYLGAIGKWFLQASIDRRQLYAETIIVISGAWLRNIEEEDGRQ